MISMHCPACGAEGRVPKDKVNVRMLCKRCLKSFHLTPEGKVVAGPPPMDHAGTHEERHGPNLDAVDHEIDVVVGKLKSAVPKVAIVAGLGLILLLVWMVMRRGEVASLNDQTIRLARALARNDVEELRSLAVEGTGDEAAELSQALAPEFRDHADIHHTASPTVEVARKPEAPGPGLAEVVATIRADRPVGRMGEAIPDVSVSLKPAAVEVPLVLSGDDQKGWRLDGERSLAAFRSSRALSPSGPAEKSTAPSPKSPTADDVEADPGA
jgi:hypothetical protein